MSDIIIPATMSSDYPMSEPSDPFATDIIQNSFPLSTENEVSEEGNTFDHLELSPNKKYALWRRDMVEYWNPGGDRSSNRPKLKVNLVTLSGRRQRDQRCGGILNSVLIFAMVLRRLSARHVGRYMHTLSSRLVAVVQLLYGSIMSIRNVVAQ